MKEKRPAVGVGKAGRVDELLRKEELVVQRLSSDVSGKQQKYSRVGPREFVAYEYDEVTADNIKAACEKHFKPRLGSNKLMCNILAGEQGPSCKSVDQIPNMTVIHIWFIEPVGLEGSLDVDTADSVDYSILPPAFKKKRDDTPFSNSSSSKSILEQVKYRHAVPTVTVPKSLSIREMLQLGKVINDSAEPITLHRFDMGTMTWCGTRITVDFKVEKEPLGSGGFRKAYRARSVSSIFGDNREWVVKTYLPEAKEIIAITNQTITQH